MWAVTHKVTLQKHALKLLKSREGISAAMRQRFMYEARAAAVVQHPNVVKVFDLFELDDGVPVMVLELLDGESLQLRMSDRARLEFGEVADIMLQVVSAVGAAHTHGIVHRHLKPDNIFLALGEDGGLQVKVLDFGIAKLAAGEEIDEPAEGLTRTGALVGTPMYMSPEQATADKWIDHRADIWSLGIITYQALSGVPPTKADSLGAVLKIILREEIAPLTEYEPELPADVLELVSRMLSAERSARPKDLREVADVLRRHAAVEVPDFAARARVRLAMKQFDTTVLPSFYHSVFEWGRTREPGSVKGVDQIAAELAVLDKTLAEVVPEVATLAAFHFGVFWQRIDALRELSTFAEQLVDVRPDLRKRLDGMAELVEIRETGLLPDELLSTYRDYAEGMAAETD